MDYFKILNLTKEPFSNSPDPELFYNSRQHLRCLQQLELSLRLRRGLNVVIGDVGTGKTTLCRQLIRRFANDETIETHLILDPHFSNDSEFLSAVAEMLVGKQSSQETNNWQIKESIKTSIFSKGVDEDRIVVLIIDEGQKIPDFCLEILREFLNFETNDRKLLQIVIFAQKEFDRTLQTYPNVSDRIDLYHFLPPLNFRDTRLMIRHRLAQSGATAETRSLFSFLALWMIYRATGGYPRKIVTLCHRSLLTMIVQNRNRASWLLVRASVKRVFSDRQRKWRLVTATTLISVLVTAIIIAALSPKYLTGSYSGKTESHRVDPLETEIVAVQQPSAGPPIPAPVVAAVSAPVETDNSGDHPEIAPAPTDTQIISPRQIDPPATLGTIAVQQGETFGELIQKVYGKADPEFLNRIAAFNLHIDDPDHLDIGDIIHLPAIPASVRPLSSKYWWVEIGNRDRMEDAFRLLRSYAKNMRPIRLAPIRLIPYWNDPIGIKISVVIPECYTDKSSAHDKLNKTVAPEGRVVSLWDEGITFYADPFLSINRKSQLPGRAVN